MDVEDIFQHLKESGCIRELVAELREQRESDRRAARRAVRKERQEIKRRIRSQKKKWEMVQEELQIARKQSKRSTLAKVSGIEVQVRVLYSSNNAAANLVCFTWYQSCTYTSLSNFLTAMTFHMAYVQYATTALISLNRFSVLLKYTWIEPAWKHYTWLLMLTIYILPAVNTLRNYETEILYLNDTDSYKYESPMPSSAVFKYLIPFMVITTIISATLNIASLSIVRSMKTQLRQKVETNLIIIMSLTCLVQVLGTALSVAIVWTVGLPICRVFAFILPFVSDGLTLIQPWLLLGFSQAIREKISVMLGLKMKTSILFVPRSNTW
ncbi:hypothetical protein CRE_20953 [Caenorhabditis remanei]|uniref:Serpentine receptor class gamma n=1 Tax=Caenorhabditis remanei TaxID=31234 RepID=E3NCR0_CAERE|nr:hypothetical protein CRE_20953 [Caenorhabditis remanei]